jgi:hypothetical protein
VKPGHRPRLPVTLMSYHTKGNPVATVKEGISAMVADMKTIEDMKVGAQQSLDELFAERLIPFSLSAQVVESLGLEEYIVRFQDARLHAVDVSWPEGRSFKEMVRAAVLDRVSRLGRPGQREPLCVSGEKKSIL